MPQVYKYYVSLLLTVFLFHAGYAQKKFSVTILLDSNIDSHNVYCQYYNGKNNMEVTDSFINNTSAIKGAFFSDKVTFTVSYRNNGLITYKEDFFIAEKPARITICYNGNNEMRSCKNLVNALPILNEVYNPLYNGLLQFRKKEAIAVSEFWENYGDKIGVNDSIRQQSIKLFKALNKRTSLFLKVHPRDYFSFWYFKNQITYPAIAMMGNDRSYFKELIVVFKNTFREKFANSFEGKALLKEMEIYANPPLKEGVSAPVFEMKDIAGKLVKSGAHKSKFLLLNFWQTWCAPCIREIPSLIELKEKYNPGKLEIISINNEPNYNKVINFIKEHNMTWTNIWDKNDYFKYLFRVNAYPTMILIDNKGVIKYVSIGLSETKDISKIIEE